MDTDSCELARQSQQWRSIDSLPPHQKRQQVLVLGDGVVDLRLGALDFDAGNIKRLCRVLLETGVF